MIKRMGDQAPKIGILPYGNVEKPRSMWLKCIRMHLWASFYYYTFKNIGELCNKLLKSVPNWTELYRIEQNLSVHNWYCVKCNQPNEATKSYKEDLDLDICLGKRDRILSTPLPRNNYWTLKLTIEIFNCFPGASKFGVGRPLKCYNRQNWDICNWLNFGHIQ